MKVAFLQLSDFHLGENEQLSNIKIKRIATCLNPIAFDTLFLVIAGDLANKGKKEEYKVFGVFLRKLIEELKKVNDNKYIEVFIVPGNHDLNFPESERTSASIIKHYDENRIETILDDEFNFMHNFYEYSSSKCISIDANHFAKSVKIPIGKEFFQVNLINTAPFSTRLPDNKELHYFPEKELQVLDRKDNISFCITVMHHSVDWFNYRYKKSLENAIIGNSEFLFYGHDHVEENKTISLNNGNYIWVSASGEMKICQETEIDSFHILCVDTTEGTFNSYQFEWQYNNRIYHCIPIVEGKRIPKRSDVLEPDYSFIAELKEDKETQELDFTQYFVFPKIVRIYEDSKKENDIKSIESLQSCISNKKRIIVTGTSNSGKTMLLKQLFLSYVGKKVPLFLSVEQFTKINIKTFEKNLFENCYGKNASFEKYQQLDKENKILIIDGWDLLKIGKSESAIIGKLVDTFGTIVLSVSSKYTSLIEDG